MGVYEHELRHFHDFLLSPYSSALLRLKLTAFVNGFQALNQSLELSGSKPNCIPVPIVDWLFTSKTSRTSQRAEWSRMWPREDGKLWSTPGLPMFSSSTLGSAESISDCSTSWERFAVKPEHAKFLESHLYLIANVYQSIERYTRGFARGSPPELHPSDVFELTAILVQAQVILRVTDKDTYYDFLKSACQSPRYGKFLSHLLMTSKTNRRGPGTDYYTALCWAMLGRSFGSDPQSHPSACPARRFDFLLQRFNDEGFPNEHRDSKSLFREWDAAFRSTTVDEALESVSRANADASSKYRKLAADLGFPFTALSTAFDWFIKQQRLMQERFSSNPDDYADPFAYYDMVDTLPKPPIRVFLDGFSFANGREISIKNWIPGSTYSNGANNLIGDFIVPSEGSAPISEIISTANLLAEVDYYYQPFDRSDSDLLLAGKRLKSDSIGLEVFNVFSENS